MINLGRILEVDVSTGNWTLTPFPQDILWQVLAGRGFNIWYLLQHLPDSLDPLGPDNILVFSGGLLTGTRAPASSRLHVNALSPLTGLLGSSNVGGNFGAALRSCQIQTLIIRGKATKPVYLSITEDAVELVDAQAFWGLDTRETEIALRRERQDDGLKCLVIGPGGENGALFGCIMTDWDHAVGRTGLGTVMGAKHLKAIVVKPAKAGMSAARSQTEREVIKTYIQKVRQTAEFETHSLYGGAGYITWCNDMGIMPTRNYQENRFADIEQVDGKRLRPYVARSRGCARCPIQCKAQLQFPDAQFNGKPLSRPEFESLITFGPKCGLSDLKMTVYLDNLCSLMGLDSISTGTTIGFAMDLFERGFLTLADTENLPLRWGDGAVMERLIRQMAYREGVGALLSLGVRRMAQLIGNGAERFAPHVKGLELSAYNPREILGTALGYAVANRGGDFSHVHPSLEYRWSPEKAAQEFQTPLAVDIHSRQGKAAVVKRATVVGVALDCLGLCKVPALGLLGDFDLHNETELLAACLNEPVEARTLFTIGERVVTLERLFNLKHGASRADDSLPAMFLKPDETNQPPVPLEPMLQEYYAAMGWDEYGRPSAELLHELGL
jgi:aldehyde:ferredoxin oxidoreductase